jgi:protease-4
MDDAKQNFSFVRFFLKVTAVLSAFVVAMMLPVIVFGLLFIVFVVAVGSTSEVEKTSALETSHVYGSKDAQDKLLQLPIEGIILGDRSDLGDFSSFLFGGITYASDIEKYLQLASKDKDIEGVVLGINSPGGTVVGSERIAKAVREYRMETQKPVYGHISGLGASGAYWVGMETDELSATVGSSVGSIGVIMGEVLYYDEPTALSSDLGGGVVTENGIESYFFSAGKGKDFGNPFRRPTQEEIQIYQQMLENEYGRFVSLVSQARGINKEQIRNEIGAFVYDVASAKENGLVDEESTRKEAYGRLAESAGISNGYEVIEVASPGFWDSILGASLHFVPQRDLGEALKASTFCAPRTVMAYYGEYGAVCQR